MDSALTLVDPSLRLQTVLVFCPDTSNDAEVYHLHWTSEHTLAYTIRSSSSGDTTDIVLPNGTVLATLRRRMLGSTMTLRGETKRLSKWIKSPKISHLCVPCIRLPTQR
jgi:hypothetical protein